MNLTPEGCSIFSAFIDQLAQCDISDLPRFTSEKCQDGKIAALVLSLINGKTTIHDTPINGSTMTEFLYAAIRTEGLIKQLYEENPTGFFGYFLYLRRDCREPQSKARAEEILVELLAKLGVSGLSSEYPSIAECGTSRDVENQVKFLISHLSQEDAVKLLLGIAPHMAMNPLKHLVHENLGNPYLLDAFLESIKSRDTLKRKAAIHVLTEIGRNTGDLRAVAEVLRLLSDPNESVRVSVGFAINDFRSSDILVKTKIQDFRQGLKLLLRSTDQKDLPKLIAGLISVNSHPFHKDAVFAVATEIALPQLSKALRSRIKEVSPKLKPDELEKLRATFTEFYKDVFAEVRKVKWAVVLRGEVLDVKLKPPRNPFYRHQDQFRRAFA